MREMHLEFSAMLDRFGVVARRWRLSDEEQVFVLGIDCLPTFGTCPWHDAEVETTMRLLIQLDMELAAWMSEDEIAIWVHAEPPSGPDPLTFMSLGVPQVRALLRAVRNANDSHG